MSFTAASTEEVTLRYVLPSTRAARMTTSVTGFHTTVDHDLIFDPTEATTVAVGPTDRLGALAWARVQPRPWMDLNAWVAYTSSTVESAALDGRLAAGSAIPYLPALVARLDAAVDGQVATVARLPLRMHAGLGASLRGAAGMIATPPTPVVALLDANVGARLGFVGLDLSAKNLLDTRWHAADFEYPSNFNPAAMRDATPVRHFVAGSPLLVFATVSLSL